MDTTFEEAKRCPKCSNPGQATMQRPAPAPTVGTLHFFQCRNERCVWFEDKWSVQTRPDGTVVQPSDNRGPKKYMPMSPGTESRGLRMVEDAVGRDLRDSRELEK